MLLNRQTVVLLIDIWGIIFRKENGILHSYGLPEENKWTFMADTEQIWFTLKNVKEVNVLRKLIVITPIS
jgi:hypothetical protein